jgi:hypothetical protein
LSLTFFVFHHTVSLPGVVVDLPTPHRPTDRCSPSASFLVLPFFFRNSERKNVNLPGVVVDLPTLTDKDIDDIVNWGVANEIDLIAASFVRKGRDLDEIREVLGDKGR